MALKKQIKVRLLVDHEIRGSIKPAGTELTVPIHKVNKLIDSGLAEKVVEFTSSNPKQAKAEPQDTSDSDTNKPD